MKDSAKLFLVYMVLNNIDIYKIASGTHVNYPCFPIQLLMSWFYPTLIKEFAFCNSLWYMCACMCAQLHTCLIYLDEYHFTHIHVYGRRWRYMCFVRLCVYVYFCLYLFLWQFAFPIISSFELHLSWYIFLIYPVHSFFTKI